MYIFFVIRKKKYIFINYSNIIKHNYTHHTFILLIGYFSIITDIVANFQ